MVPHSFTLFWNEADKPLLYQITLPVITWYAIFTIRPKCQQRTTIFAECEVSLSRFLMHRLYCWSDRPILCGNLVEFDGKKCLYSTSMRFYKQFDVSEKNMGYPLHTKKYFPTFPLLANADKFRTTKIEWFSEAEKFLLLTCDRDPKSILIDIPYFDIPLTFVVIPYTLKTLERYFLRV